LTKIKLGKYQHYKSKFYQVIGIAYDSETLEENVVYRALYDDKKFGKNALWVRSRTEFTEKIFINGKKTPRYRFIGDL